MRAREFVQEQMINKSDHNYTTAYHVTGMENAEEIVLSGLRPAGGKAFLVVDEGDPKKMREELYTVSAWMDAKAENQDEEMTMLRVNVAGLPLAYEDGWHFSTTTIPANRIKDLGPDTLRRSV